MPTATRINSSGADTFGPSGPPGANLPAHARSAGAALLDRDLFVDLIISVRPISRNKRRAARSLTPRVPPA
ncbi:hypothetical protein ACFFSY_23000 [Paenibacillus aurantiacus]|uniref:Uncharacterized protein n=1 Tax=Paenibacillus aurantiacus TaxID=1936118 RepID=A0ABV5KWJ4_9BACL